MMLIQLSVLFVMLWGMLALFNVAYRRRIDWVSNAIASGIMVSICAFAILLSKFVNG